MDVPRKRIIVCTDGTWMNSDGEQQEPSNVTRICRCIKQEGVHTPTGTAVPQVVYYQSGVGTGESLWNKYIAGATGAGISEHIREAYSFICTNYYPGDEIFIIGFSRGAFTARSIASLIRAVGLLTPTGLGFFYQIFEDWEFQLKKGWTSAYPLEPWPHRPTITTPEYQRKLLELELTRPNIPIKAVAVWDTVGALGIPKIALLPQPPSTDYAFVDTKVEPNIEYAFQALALDEHRRSYTPTIWEKPSGQQWPRVLKQCWFPGVHADVGGSYTDADLSNLTLAWMISQLDSLITFDHGYVARLNRLSIERQTTKRKTIRTWGTGKIHDSMSLFYRLGGSKIRTPGEYFEIDNKSHTFTSRRLENTNESIHSSVRIRMGQQGLGYNDRGKYDSDALQGWTMKATEEPASEAATPVNMHSPGAVVKGRIRDVHWVKTLHGNKEMPELVLPEDPLGVLERTILSSWPDLLEQFDTILPGSHAVSMKRSGTWPNNHPGSMAGGTGIATRLGMPQPGTTFERRYGGKFKSPHREETV